MIAMVTVHNVQLRNIRAEMMIIFIEQYNTLHKYMMRSVMTISCEYFGHKEYGLRIFSINIQVIFIYMYIHIYASRALHIA